VKSCWSFGCEFWKTLRRGCSANENVHSTSSPALSVMLPGGEPSEHDAPVCWWMLELPLTE
jgi:hypothetical protein